VRWVRACSVGVGGGAAEWGRPADLVAGPGVAAGHRCYGCPRRHEPPRLRRPLPNREREAGSRSSTASPSPVPSGALRITARPRRSVVGRCPGIDLGDHIPRGATPRPPPTRQRCCGRSRGCLGAVWTSQIVEDVSGQPLDRYSCVLAPQSFGTSIESDVLLARCELGQCAECTTSIGTSRRLASLKASPSVLSEACRPSMGRAMGRRASGRETAVRCSFPRTGYCGGTRRTGRGRVCGTQREWRQCFSAPRR
jgi:hypothetical protein